MEKYNTAGKFIFEHPKTKPIGTALYHEHLKLSDKMRLADFAGYLMPLWFTSISAEHRAVRQAAGLFDCTHMGTLEIAGPDAAAFLNLVTTNNIDNLTAGTAQYSFIPDAAGNVLDDIIIYRRCEENFMMVVNAANEPKIKAYFQALKSNRALLDVNSPEKKLEYKPSIRDMKDTGGGADCVVDIALQGPKAKDILLTLVDDKNNCRLIEELRPFHFVQAEVCGLDCTITRTGYTGAKIGFELFVHPQKAARLWNLLLEKGQPAGLLPCGLGARDSLRIEAGLPLYGHELNGISNISPFEAGYGWAVKLEKPSFIGKAAIAHRAKSVNMKIVRLALPAEKGIRPVRQNDAVLSGEGRCIGQVTSCAKAEDKQIALAFVENKAIKENDVTGIYYLARSPAQVQQGRRESVEIAEQLNPDITGKVISRFEKF